MPALESDSLGATVSGDVSHFNWLICKSLLRFTLIVEVMVLIPLSPLASQLWLERWLLIEACSFLPPMIESPWYWLLPTTLWSLSDLDNDVATYYAYSSLIFITGGTIPTDEIFYRLLLEYWIHYSVIFLLSAYGITLQMSGEKLYEGCILIALPFVEVMNIAYGWPRELPLPWPRICMLSTYIHLFKFIYFLTEFRNFSLSHTVEISKLTCVTIQNISQMT